MSKPKMIITSLQTDSDFAVADICRSWGIKHSGYMPKGFTSYCAAGDWSTKPAKKEYNVKEWSTKSVAQISKKHVDSTDVTIVFMPRETKLPRHIHKYCCTGEWGGSFREYPYTSKQGRPPSILINDYNFPRSKVNDFLVLHNPRLIHFVGGPENAKFSDVSYYTTLEFMESLLTQWYAL